MRVRQLAAMALGAIGDHRALPALRRRLNDPSDPRVQVYAANAILEILSNREPGVVRRASMTQDNWTGIAP